MLQRERAVCFGSRGVCHIGIQVQAETLWISTSFPSILRRLNCCWTLFVIPAKLPESFALLQLFVTPHTAECLCCYSQPIIRFMTMEKADETEIAAVWGASSVTLSPQGQTHKPQRPDRAHILHLLLFSARLSYVSYCSYDGKTFLNYVMKCILINAVYFRLFFRVNWGLENVTGCYSEMKKISSILILDKKLKPLMT